MKAYTAHQHHIPNSYLYAHAIIDAINEPILVLDTKLTIQSANAAYYTTFQTTPKITLQQNINSLTQRNPQIGELITQLNELHQKHREFKEFELTYHFKNAGTRVMLINAQGITLDQKTTELIMIRIEDITQRKRIEQQKDDFVGYVTHELKTPITSLSAFVQILQGHHNKTGDKKSQFLLAKIADQTERITKLLNTFQNVYKARTGMIELNRESFDFLTLLQEAITTIEYTTTTHVIQLNGTCTKKIRADKERIRQVIINLIMNAIKYSPNAHTITITINEQPKQLIVAIQDFGLGIPKNQQKHIFDRFFRVKAKEDYHVKGLGLGLYITQEIIQAHGGKIWVESEEDKGSTFSFSLPRR
jgi:signal transduction histidine kinase